MWREVVRSYRKEEMKKLVVIMLGFVMMGCVNKTDLVVEDLEKSDNSSLEVLVEKIELPEPKGWTESNTGFWKAMFWYRMAQDMQIRMIFSPEQVYNIASCVHYVGPYVCIRVDRYVSLCCSIFARCYCKSKFVC